MESEAVETASTGKSFRKPSDENSRIWKIDL